jgi:hypothetical protein
MVKRDLTLLGSAAAAADHALLHVGLEHAKRLLMPLN